MTHNTIERGDAADALGPPFASIAGKWARGGLGSAVSDGCQWNRTSSFGGCIRRMWIVRTSDWERRGETRATVVERPAGTTAPHDSDRPLRFPVLITLVPLLSCDHTVDAALAHRCWWRVCPSRPCLVCSLAESHEPRTPRMSRLSSPAMRPSFGVQHSPMLGVAMPMPPSPTHSPMALALDEATMAAESIDSRATPASPTALSPTAALSSVLAREKRVTGGVRFADDSPATSSSSNRVFFGSGTPPSPVSARPASATSSLPVAASSVSPTLSMSSPPTSPTAAAAKISSLSVIARLASSKLSPQGASAFASKFASKWKTASFGASPVGSPKHAAAPNPLQWEDKPIVAPPQESDAERERRLTAKGNEDLAFLLGMSPSADGGGGGGALFSNVHVKRKTANLAELQSVEIQRRKSSVADQAERMANIKRAMAVAEQTSANNRRRTIVEEDATNASPPETPETATDAALPSLPSAIDVAALPSDGTAAPDSAKSSPTGDADADLQRLLAADDTPERSGEEDTSTEESDADEKERTRKRTKRSKFLAKKAEREARLAEMFAAAEKRAMAEAEKRHAAQHGRQDDAGTSDDATKAEDGSTPGSATGSRRSSHRHSRGATEWLAEKARLRLLLSPSARNARGEVEEETEEEKAAMAASIAEAKRIAREEEEEDRRAEIRAKEEAERAAAALVAAEEAATAAAAEAKRRKRRSRRTQSSQISPAALPADSAVDGVHHRGGSLQLSQRRQAAGSSSVDGPETPGGESTPTKLRTRRQTGGPPGSDSAEASSARARAIHARTVSMDLASSSGTARSSRRRTSNPKGVLRPASGKRSSGGAISSSVGSAMRDANSLSITLPSPSRAKKSHLGGVHFGAEADSDGGELDADGLPKVRVQVLGGLTHRGGVEVETESGEDDESYTDDDDEDEMTPDGTAAPSKVEAPLQDAESNPDASPVEATGELVAAVYSDEDNSPSGSVVHSRQSSLVAVAGVQLVSPKQRPASAGRVREAVRVSLKRMGSVSAPTSPGIGAVETTNVPPPVQSSLESALNDSAAAETAAALASDVSVLDDSSAAAAVQVEDAPPGTPPSEQYDEYAAEEPEPEPAYTPEYLTPARRAQAHLPARAGCMSFFVRTPSNKVLRPGTPGYTPGRSGAPYSAQVLAAFGRQPGPTQEEKEEAAAAARELAARSREKIGFGSGSSQRPKAALRGLRKKPLVHSESFETLRSTLSPSVRSARRLYGATPAMKKSRSAASGLTVDQGQGIAGVASARHAYSPSRTMRERNEDGSLKPPWVLSTARTPVDNPAATMHGAFRTSLPLKQAALTARVQRMNGAVPSSSLLDEFGAPIASNCLVSSPEIESTRRAVERRMQNSARSGSSRPFSASTGSLHHIITVPAPSRSLQQFSAAAASTPSLSVQVDALFATPTPDPPSPFKARNLFEHTSPSEATKQTQGPDSVSAEEQSAAQHPPPAPTAARPVTHRGPVASIPPSLFTFEQQEQSAYFQPDRNRTLGSSASTPALYSATLPPAPADRNGLVRGRTPGSATKRISSRDVALREAALKRQAAAERLKHTQEAAARSAAAQQRELAARTRGGSKGWLEVMMLEAKLVAAQKLQAAQEQEIGSLLASTTAVASEEKEQQQLFSSRPSSPKRVAVAARAGQSYASPVPLAPAHFQPAMTAPPDLQLHTSSSATEITTHRPASAAVKSRGFADASARANRSGRTVGGMDHSLRGVHASASAPSLLAQQPHQPQPQLWPPVQRGPPSVADWAGSILAAVSDSPPHSQYASGLDPMATWRASQGRGSTGNSPLQVPLSDLISSIKHVQPILRMGTPGRSEYAAKLQAGQRALSDERVRRLRALAPPEHPYILEAEF